jgi:hypothetical protein
MSDFHETDRSDLVEMLGTGLTNGGALRIVPPSMPPTILYPITYRPSEGPE